MRKELMRCFTAGASAVGWNHQAETVATGVVPFFPQQRMWLLIKSSGLRWFQHVSTSACIVCVCSITSIIVYLLRIGKSLSFFRVELNSTCKYSRSEIASWKLDNPQAVRRFPSWLWVEGSSSVAMVAFPFRLRFFYGKLLINAGLPIAMLPCLITRGYISAEIAVLSSRTGPCSRWIAQEMFPKFTDTRHSWGATLLGLFGVSDSENVLYRGIIGILSRL